MGKGGSAKQQVNEYNMSIHFGICAEMDEMTGFYVGEKQAWAGHVSTLSTFFVDKSNLFGGPKKEGGVRGYVTFLPGGPTQQMPADLAARRGLTPTTHPAYRGLASVYFTGSGTATVGTVSPWNAYYATTRSGFYWGATPYMQGVWIQGKRAPKGLDSQYALLGTPVSVTINTATYLATVGGTSATLTDSIPTTIAGYAVRLSRAVTTTHELSWTVALDSTVVTLTLNKVVDGITLGGWTVDYGAETGRIVGESVTLAGLTVTLIGGVIGIQFGSVGTDANPAHMIYECLTNQTWGMGATDDVIDRANFEDVAQTLFHEGFGLSMLWTREQSIETFIGEILDHIQAAIFLDPETGKLTIKLLREDYAPDTLPLITPDNAVLDNFQRKLWGETINEVVVTWTNPTNEQEETITYQDLGNITVQSGVVSDSRNYYGIRSASLASRIAMRDVRQSSAPLASAEALLDRANWNLKPSSLVRMTWPEYDIENIVMRVTNIDYGKIGEPDITVTLLEDIFSIDEATYSDSALGGGISGAHDPTPMDLTKIITAPAYFTSRYLSAGDAAALVYPDVYASILSATSNTDASYYEVVGRTVLPNGDTVSQERGTKGLLGYAVLPDALADEATTTLTSFPTVLGGVAPGPATFMFIGNIGEKIQEIALIESRDATTGVWTIARGVLDTVPRPWPANTPVWFCDIRNNFFDPTAHSAGETVAYKLLTITSLGRLEMDDAPVQGATLTARPHLPLRPANVKVAGVAFGAVDLSSSPPSTVVVTWSNRNRTMEDGTIVRWGEATIVPETGQTTTIRVIHTNGTVLATHAGIAGTSFTLPVSDWGSEIEADVQVVSVRDGLESLMGATRRVRVAPAGYGDFYGDDYGGTVTIPPAAPPPVVDPDPIYTWTGGAFPPRWNFG